MGINLYNLPSTPYDQHFWLLRAHLAVAGDAGFSYLDEFTVEALGGTPTFPVAAPDTPELEAYPDEPCYRPTWAEDAEYVAYCQTAGRFDTCPEHGRRKVLSYGSTGGSDPYGTTRLDCGHKVACFGPGEPNVVVR